MQFSVLNTLWIIRLHLTLEVAKVEKVNLVQEWNVEACNHHTHQGCALNHSDVSENNSSPLWMNKQCVIRIYIIFLQRQSLKSAADKHIQIKSNNQVK